MVATFQQAGVEKIVMITGFNATLLERHLSGNGIVFLRNEEYERTQMFDSVCIGLRYLRGKCDRVLFTPVDIPLFTAATVRALLETDAELACPAVDGETGHPTLIAASLIDRILSDPGDQGLRGALERCGAELTRVPVEDRGVLHDADTPEDYKALLKYHNEQLVRPVLSVSLAREKVFFDSRAAMLLQLIDETQSVRSDLTAGQEQVLTQYGRQRFILVQDKVTADAVDDKCFSDHVFSSCLYGFLLLPS